MPLALGGCSGGIPGIEGKHSHLVFNKKGPAVLGNCAVPYTLYPSSTDREPTSSLSLLSKTPTKLGEAAPGLENPGPNGQA